MNELNSIFTSLTDIDDSIISEAKRKKHRVPLAIKLAVIAAALAAVVGFTIAYRNTVSLNNHNVFDYNLTVQEMTIPSKEELTALGAVDEEKGEYTFKWRVLPDKLFDTFGIKPLINDNFIVKECDTHIRINISGETAFNAEIDYDLTDKSGTAVGVTIFCMLKEGAGLSSNYIMDKTDESGSELFDLNNGSKGLLFDYYLGGLDITKSYADFSYDGIAYQLYAETDKEGMKKIISDLGVM